MAYKRITYTLRLEIERFYNTFHMNAVQIAKLLGYSHVAIYAELKKGYWMKRNSDWTETKQYSADRAQQNADFNKTTRGAQLKIENDHDTLAVIEKLMLKRKLSPASALATIEREHIPVKTKMCVTTLYHYIDKGLFRRLTNKDLIYKGTRKRKYRKVEKAKTPPRGTSIDFRPPHVLNRDEFGHWELDSVIGKRAKGQTLLVLTERKTRFELVFRSKDKTAASTVKMLDRLEKRLGTPKFKKIFKTITCDNGCEFADYENMELSTRGNSRRTSVYYCHPYRSSERGSNENQNGILRRFIKKGTAISHYTDAEIAQARDYLNDMPRKLFNWETARERFNAELATLGIKFFEKI
ncbi:MAG: IS30 family transposase [Clostridia bacterium]|nr:IS30 family transposase [Clostridia bacterium]